MGLENPRNTPQIRITTNHILDGYTTWTLNRRDLDKIIGETTANRPVKLGNYIVSGGNPTQVEQLKDYYPELTLEEGEEIHTLDMLSRDRQRHYIALNLEKPVERLDPSEHLKEYRKNVSIVDAIRGLKSPQRRH